MEKEIWKPVVGYEGKYEVSNLGNVASLNYRNTGKRNLLSPTKRSNGYYCITPLIKGRKCNMPVHRLVGKAFIPNPENKPQINHIDGNKLNNRVENLEWCTCSENTLHAVKMGLKVMPIGEGSTSSKTVYQYTKDGIFIRAYGSTTEAERITGIHSCNIGQCCRGYLRTSGGFIWSYHPLPPVPSQMNLF